MKDFFDKIRKILFPSLYDFGEVEGIIGGSDGPTVIVVANRQGGPDIELFAFLLVLAVIVTVLILRKRKK